MGVTVVVGGQYGSEGKGKVLAHLAMRDDYAMNIRCGGPNSGHTVWLDGKRMPLLQVPCAVPNEGTRLLTAPGGVVHTNILLEELEMCGIDEKRYGIDYRTAVIDEDACKEEDERGFHLQFGSTRSGTGIGVARRVMRTPESKRAEDVPVLKPYLTDVIKEVDNTILNGGHILVEGTQGSGLSVYLTRKWPYATARDTNAAGFISECGISPLLVDRVVLVLRAFPIRVGGNSGPMHDEITWEKVQEISGCPELRQEITTVTKRLRRVGMFDWDMVNEAVMINRPTQIAVMGMDYLNWRDFGRERYEDLSQGSKDFIERIEETWGVPVKYIGVGPNQDHLIDRSTF